MKIKKDLIEKLGEALKEFNIDAEIKIYRQLFCSLKDTEVENHEDIYIEKSLGQEFT